MLSSNELNPTSICDRVHFRPLIRPHTDVTLGHCSYLNTCYSEPTYAQSPSIHPFFAPNQGHGAPPNTRGAVSLPSGLGAGGRGKEKAPCRYLHYEIDWDGGDGDWKKDQIQRNTSHKLSIGLAPTGQITKPVGISHSFYEQKINFASASSAMDQLRFAHIRLFDLG